MSTTPAQDDQLLADLFAILADNTDDQDRLAATIANANANGVDPLLDQLRSLARTRDNANTAIRALLAYARNNPATGSKYRLQDLADATGLTISGVSTAWRQTDLDAVQRAVRDARR